MYKPPEVPMKGINSTPTLSADYEILNKTTTVNYFEYNGLHIILENWVNFLAVDECSNLIAYEIEPTIEDECTVFHGGRMAIITKIDFAGHWQESLRAVPNGGTGCTK